MAYKNDNEIHCFRAEDRNRNPTSSRMAVVITNQHAYRGYLGENLPTDQMNTYVAIRNKRTGKMRLVQVEECNMLNACYDDNNIMFQKEESSLTVMRKFGGKMAIRALERIERSSSNIDVISESIDQMLIEYDDELFTEDNAFTKTKLEGELILASMKPPRNTKASSPADVYQLGDMVSRPLLDNLKQIGLEMMQEEPETLQFANIYLTNKMKSALQYKEPDSDENIRTIQICLYMDALCRLLKCNHGSFDEIMYAPLSSELHREIKQNFAQPNHHKPIKTKYTTHKAMNYYLAMAFMLENGVLNVDQVQSGLNVTKSTLLKFAAVVGGSFNSKKKILTLGMAATSSTGK